MTNKTEMVSVPRELLQHACNAVQYLALRADDVGTSNVPVADALRALLAAPAEGVCAMVDEPVAWANGQQLLLCEAQPLHVEHPNKIYHDLPRPVAGSALKTEYCDTPLYRHPAPLRSEVAPQCSEQLRIQAGLFPVALPHPPRHTGFLEPDREVPGYTVEQMKEYGAACVAAFSKQNGEHQ